MSFYTQVQSLRPFGLISYIVIVVLNGLHVCMFEYQEHVRITKAFHAVGAALEGRTSLQDGGSSGTRANSGVIGAGAAPRASNIKNI